MKNRISLFLFSISLVLFCSCDEDSLDLPAGWEGAKEVAYYVTPTSTECGSGTEETQVGAEIRDSKLSIRVAKIGLHYSEYHTAVVRQQGDDFDLLIIQTDVIACPPLPKNARAVLNGVTQGSQISIYRAFGEDPSEAELLAVASIEDDGDCFGLNACTSDLDCNSSDPEDQYSYNCYEIDQCGGQFCTWDNELEWMEEHL